MTDEAKLIDFGAERAKRIHDIKDKRLDEMRNAFEQAMPLSGSKKPGSKKAGKKPKKR